MKLAMLPSGHLLSPVSMGNMQNGVIISRQVVISPLERTSDTALRILSVKGRGEGGDLKTDVFLAKKTFFFSFF